jgi:hypothetical protein
MSHFALRVGNFFHFHPFAHTYLDSLATPNLDSLATPKTTAPVGVVHRWEPSRPKGLAFFALCSRGHRETGRVELDRLALVCDGGDPLHEQDELWLSIM